MARIAPGTLLIFHGNSLTFGSNGTIPFPLMLDAMTDDSIRVVNEGASGETTQQLTAELASDEFAEYAAASEGRRILIIFECRNDMVVNGITPAQAVDNLAAYRAAVPEGFTRVCVVTPSIDESGDPNFTTTDWTDVCDLIRSRISELGDELIDLAADARFQDADNTTYFADDKIHYRNGGNQAVADIVQAAIAPSSVGTGLVFSAADAAVAGVTLWADDRAAQKTDTAWSTVRGDVSKSTGKWYFELQSGHADTSDNYMFGLATADAVVSSALSGYLGSSPSGVGFQGSGGIFANGFTTTGTTHAALNYGGSAGAPRAGLIAMLAVDFTSGKIWTGYNDIWFGDPVSGTGPAATFTPGMELFPGLTLQNPNNGSWVLKTTAGKLSYDPPAGFLAWGGGDVVPDAVQWNETQADAKGFTLASGNTHLAKTGASWETVRATLPKLTGKYVFELKCVAAGSVTYWVAGLCNYGFNAQLLGSASMSVALTIGTATDFTGTVADHSETPPLNLSITVAVDFDSGKVWEARNGVWRNSGDPAAGTGNEWSFTPGTALFPAMSLYQPESGTWALLTEEADLTYSLPSGFSAWGA